MKVKFVLPVPRPPLRRRLRHRSFSVKEQIKEMCEVSKKRNRVEKAISKMMIKNDFKIDKNCSINRK